LPCRMDKCCCVAAIGFVLQTRLDPITEGSGSLDVDE
jgi:hypothetical protein